MILCFLQDSLSSIMHDRIITVQGCCKSSSCIFIWHPDERGRHITVACNKLSRWKGLKSDSFPGWCCLAVRSSAGGWQVPTESPLRGMKLGIVAERPSSCIERNILLCPFPIAFQESTALLSLFLLNVPGHQSILDTVLHKPGVFLSFSFKAP